MITIVELRKNLNELYAETHNWREVGAAIGINKGTAYMIANGYEPKTPRLRKILKIAIMIPAPACAKCGEIHVTRLCTKGRMTHSEKWVRVPGHAGSERIK